MRSKNHHHNGFPPIGDRFGEREERAGLAAVPDDVDAVHAAAAAAALAAALAARAVGRARRSRRITLQPARTRVPSRRYALAGSYNFVRPGRPNIRSLYFNLHHH